jgi:hypothetical protein
MRLANPLFYRHGRRRRRRLAGVVVCADAETRASADYKTGENAVILNRR